MGYASTVIAIGLPVCFILAFRHPKVKKKIIAYLRKIEDNKGKVLTIPLFILVSSMVAILFNETFILNVFAGYLYGPIKGTLIYTPVYTLITIFGSYLQPEGVRKEVLELEDKYEALRALKDLGSADAMTQREVVMLSRVSPLIPYTVISEILYSTDMSLVDITLYSSIGILPSTFAYGCLGSTLPSVEDIVHHRIKIHPWIIALVVILLIPTTYAIDRFAIYLIESHKGLRSIQGSGSHREISSVGSDNTDDTTPPSAPS